MPHYAGINGRGLAVQGEVAFGGIPAFIEECWLEGWRRVAVTEMRLLASFNEHGKWMHPEIEEVKK